jgi:hypothetical protein
MSIMDWLLQRFKPKPIPEEIVNELFTKPLNPDPPRASAEPESPIEELRQIEEELGLMAERIVIEMENLNTQHKVFKIRVAAYRTMLDKYKEQQTDGHS